MTEMARFTATKTTKFTETHTSVVAQRCKINQTATDSFFRLKGEMKSRVHRDTSNFHSKKMLE